ncbi:hypothetical protein AQUCO_07000026v1 [Aquilegia coerulea]|uniref:Uncharacterized protein n=1 Tax=Aquilegia coerulea TaxID=218851 RepID=A0A2G5CAW6_AQUCA|nr:hypothetical protein AQUCO_07000026v1 [Aquilegia coerulea]
MLFFLIYSLVYFERSRRSNFFFSFFHYQIKYQFFYLVLSLSHHCYRIVQTRRELIRTTRLTVRGRCYSGSP